MVLKTGEGSVDVLRSSLCLSIQLSFSTCFASVFCYVRQTEVERASKWTAKPSFPLLILLFMHVILEPAPFPLFLSSPFSRPSFLHICVLQFMQLFLDAQTSVHTPHDLSFICVDKTRDGVFEDAAWEASQHLATTEWIFKHSLHVPGFGEHW